MCLLSLSLSVSPHGVGDGCPKAPEFTRPRSRSWQENPSPSVTLSQFQIPETGLELTQSGHVMTPRPERWSHLMQGRCRGCPPCGYVHGRCTWRDFSRREGYVCSSWAGQASCVSVYHTRSGYRMLQSRVPQNSEA